MQFFFKIIILFFIVFNFRVPIFYDSAIVSILLSALYYLFKRKSLPFTYFFQRYNAIILIGTVVLAFIVFLIAFLHHTEVMSGVEKRILIEFMMLCSIVFALPLLIEGKESTVWKELATIVCYAYALQGLISLAGYLYAPLGDFLFEMKPEDVKEAVMNPAANLDKFRLYNLSGIYFVELSAAFGITFIVFFWLQLKPDHLYMSGWKKYAVFIFIFLGNIFSGRTGFIGLLIGLAGWLLFSYYKVFTFLKSSIWYIIGFSLIILFAYNSLLSGKQRQSFNDEVFPFAFEWYYNYVDYGRFEVNSADVTMQQHYYYLYDETLLKGTGISPFGGNHPLYPHSDAGYTIDLVYGGIPFLICLIIYQSLYTIRPIVVAQRNNSRNNRIDSIFFIILFLYAFIVEIKTPTLGSLHVMEVIYLALGSGYIMQYYSQKNENELAE
ncbi:MAG: hypothetical protein FWF53_06370 [Candidatus Azobacteroides sp.]|nr:hypothetical protein [Candidatus Azobacteroides sp.]